VVADFTLALLSVVAGFLGMLLLLVTWFGGRMIEPEGETDLDPILGLRDQPAIHEAQAAFVPMPRHLTTHQEMVSWMTREMPKLLADPSSRQP
jgi:hypothetical protein